MATTNIPGAGGAANSNNTVNMSPVDFVREFDIVD